MPGAPPAPVRWIDMAMLGLPEVLFDQLGQRGDCGLLVFAIGANAYLVATRNTDLQEIHHAHRHRFGLRPAQVLDRDLTLELARLTIKDCGRASMQADL